MIDLLNQNLADISDLQLQAKQAHWNVKGPAFFSLHELFDKAAEELEGFADEIAERAVALGGVAFGTARIAANCSRLGEYPHDISLGDKHVEGAHRPGSAPRATPGRAIARKFHMLRPERRRVAGLTSPSPRPVTDWRSTRWMLCAGCEISDFD